MKREVLGFYTKIISAFLILLGFQACKDDDYQVEYGVPEAAYKVKGEVVAEDTQQGIKNIRVIFSTSEGFLPISRDTVYTNDKGEFMSSLITFPLEDFSLKIEDIDDEKNGLYDNKEHLVSFKDANFTNGSSWYLGKAEIDLGKITLAPKKK